MNSNPSKILHFNPTCEIAIANGSPYYIPPALLRDFEFDLAPIMRVFANESDFVISDNPTPKEVANLLEQAGILKGKLISRDELKEIAARSPERQFNFHPWGKSPAEAHTFKFLNTTYPLWDIKLKKLFERKTSNELLDNFLSRHNFPDFMDKNIRQQVLSNEVEIENLLAGNKPIVLKMPLSSSGRGLLVLRKGSLNKANRQWIKGNLDQQGYLLASLWLNKQYDLSFQYEIHENGAVSYLGHSIFMTNSNGQYSGHYLNFKVKNQLPFSSELINHIGSKLREELVLSDFQKFHRGILGIDALIYLTDSGSYKIHPCIEINPRFTMGYLSQQIAGKIHPNSWGHFKIFFDSKGGYKEFAEAGKKRNPPIVTDGFVKSGFFSITPVKMHFKFGAYIDLF